MVWSMIKAVYGRVVDIPTDDSDYFIEFYYDDTYIVNKYPELKLNFTPKSIRRLSRNTKASNEIVKIYKLNGDGVMAGYRDSSCGKLMNFWSHYEKPAESFDYNIPEFTPYKDKQGFYHYNYIHHYPCCSGNIGHKTILGCN